MKINKIVKIAALPFFLFTLSTCTSTSNIKFVNNLQSHQPNQKVSAFILKPEGEGPFPVAVLLSTCGGSTNRHIRRDWPRFLVENGIVAVTVKSYLSRGYKYCDDVSTLEFSLDQGTDAIAALEYLSTIPYIDADNSAVLGFSAGGIAINMIIVQGLVSGNEGMPGFKAAISLYGNCRGMSGSNKGSNIPLLQIVGEYDKIILKTCKRIQAAGFPMKIHEIKGAYHAFDRPVFPRLQAEDTGFPMKYSSKATKIAREVVMDFLNLHFEK